MEVTVENPLLSYDDIFGSWRSTEDTPLYENSLSTNDISQDIDGQVRPDLSNPGSDNYSLESIRFKPLTSEDVGPNANGNRSTAANDLNENNQSLLFPIPTDNILHLNNLAHNIDKVRIISIKGEVCIEKEIVRTKNGFSIDTAKLTNGCLLYTSPSPRDATLSRMPSSA